MNATRERPIPMRAHEVRAILDGRKTQTRRLAKLTLQPAAAGYYHVNGLPPDGDPEGPPGYGYLSLEQLAGYCPYGQPGDRLWVRETWAISGNEDGHPIDAARNLVSEREAERFYRADTSPGLYGLDTWPDGRQYGGRWRPSIHMPRWASRLTLEVVSVRVERLQAITEEDARAEGVERWPQPFTHGYRNYEREPAYESVTYHPSARESFASFWRSINGAESRAANPWVWVVEFRRSNEVET